jgi:hypothetical protein
MARIGRISLILSLLDWARGPRLTFDFPSIRAHGGGGLGNFFHVSFFFFFQDGRFWQGGSQKVCSGFLDSTRYPRLPSWHIILSHPPLTRHAFLLLLSIHLSVEISPRDLRIRHGSWARLGWTGGMDRGLFSTTTDYWRLHATGPGPEKHA